MGPVLAADNLQFFLEVSRTGRVADAARRLHVDQTTVSRRIGRLEKDLGVRLFDRTAGGWQLTDAGQEIVPYAEAVETTIVAAQDVVVDAQAGGGALSGTVRILAPDGFGTYLLMPGLSALRNRHPDLTLEVLTATTHDLLTGRDFDIGITLEEPSPRSVVVEKLGQYELKLYASRRYLDDHGIPESIDDLAEHTLIWYIEDLLDVDPLQILERHLPGVRARVQANNIAGHREAVRAGLGIAPLPTYIGKTLPDVVTVLDEEFVAERNYWLVVPRELIRLARISEIVHSLHRIVADNPYLRVPVADRPGGPSTNGRPVPPPPTV
ncbi:LysR family transcriptional regulator [Gordonia soli]